MNECVNDKDLYSIVCKTRKKPSHLATKMQSLTTVSIEVPQSLSQLSKNSHKEQIC